MKVFSRFTILLSTKLKWWATVTANLFCYKSVLGYHAWLSQRIPHFLTVVANLYVVFTINVATCIHLTKETLGNWKRNFKHKMIVQCPLLSYLDILHPLVQNPLLLCVHMWYLRSFIKFRAIMNVINGSLLSLPTLQGIGYDTSPYLVTHKA